MRVCRVCAVVRAGLEIRPGFVVEGRSAYWREERRPRFVAEVSH